MVDVVGLSCCFSGSYPYLVVSIGADTGTALPASDRKCIYSSSSASGAEAVPSSSAIFSMMTWYVNSRSSSADLAGLPLGPVVTAESWVAEKAGRDTEGANAEATAGRARRAMAIFMV